LDEIYMHQRIRFFWFSPDACEVWGPVALVTVSAWHRHSATWPVIPSK